MRRRWHLFVSPPMREKFYIAVLGPRWVPFKTSFGAQECEGEHLPISSKIEYKNQNVNHSLVYYSFGFELCNNMVKLNICRDVSCPLYAKDCPIVLLVVRAGIRRIRKERNIPFLHFLTGFCAADKNPWPLLTQ